jgi:hypothetical protein
METLDRLEPVLLSIWVVFRFHRGDGLCPIIISILRELFHIAETRYLSTPVVLLGYGGSQYLASSRFELADFSAGPGLSTNIVMTFALPFLIFLIGKIRKKI